VPGLKEKPAKEKSTANSIVEFVVIIAVALGLAIGIQAFLVKPYRIPSPSMVPTLAVGQRVLVNRLGGHFGDPQRGDILVFKPPKGAERPPGGQCGITSKPESQPCPMATPDRSDQNYIKRLVGVPGDWLKVDNNRVLVSKSENGPYKEISEGYVNKATPPCPSSEVSDCNLRTPIHVPPGHFFMMGDNRGESDDSRDWGPVPKKSIIGDAFFTYWPPSRLGTL
jgi:signal peptidase I